MRIGVIQASSQKEKNELLYELTCEYAKDHEVINLGIFRDEKRNYSYIDISIEIGILLASGAIDYAITGCSSGQGMMLACNSMPGVFCGYTPTPQDAYLFAQINNGNAVSLPLGLGFGWAGEINMKYTIEALFAEPFGQGYPKEDAQRKLADTELLKCIRKVSQVDMMDLLENLYEKQVKQALSRKNIIDCIMTNGTNDDIIRWLKTAGY